MYGSAFDVALPAVDSRVADIGVEGHRGYRKIEDRRLIVLPGHVVDGAVPQEPRLRHHGLPAEFVAVQGVGLIGGRYAWISRGAGVEAAVAKALSPGRIKQRGVAVFEIDASFVRLFGEGDLLGWRRHFGLIEVA